MKLFMNQKEILREIRNYLAGRVVGITRDELLLEEVLKCTIIKVILDHERIEFRSKEELAIKYHQKFREVVKEFPNIFKNSEILLGIEEIAFLQEKLSLINLKEMPRDFFGDAYEAFIGSNYRGQEGQFFTPLNAVDLLVNITQPKANDFILDPACGAGGFLVASLSYIKNKENTVNKNIYGIDKDQFLSEITKVRLAVQFQKIFNIFCGDSLNGEATFEKFRLNSNKFDLILTNPPFGSKIIALAEENKKKYALAHKWKWGKDQKVYTKTDKFVKNVPPQILFLERCISLLSDKGKLGIVLPESVISSPKYRYVAQYILDNCTPDAIIGMPEELFKTSGKGGTHTKVCLVVLRKVKCNPGHKIFMAEAKWCGHDSRGKTIPYDDIPAIIENYKNLNKMKRTRLGFLVSVKKIKDNILAPRYYFIDHEDYFKDLKISNYLIKIKDLINKGYIQIKTGDEVGKLLYGTGPIPFVRTSDLSNWEIKVDPKHLVDENVYQKYKKKQDVKEGDILMVKDGTYLIGTSAMVTKLDKKILYQSHLYKIRVLPNAPFDNYLFLALLSSPFVRSQIKSQSFTQDIINSLGKRIEEIIIPLPKYENVKKDISDKIREVIEKKIKAREAMTEVFYLLSDLGGNQFSKF